MFRTGVKAKPLVTPSLHFPGSDIPCPLCRSTFKEDEIVVGGEEREEVCIVLLECMA